METIKDIKEISKEIAPITTKISNIVNKANSLEINNDNDLAKAGDMLVEVNEYIKVITSAKKSITDPASKTLAAARQFFSPFELKYKTIKDIISNKMVEYNAKKTEKIEKENAKIVEKIEKGKIDFEEAGELIKEVDKTIETKSGFGKVTFRTYSEVVIENEKEVPKEYWVLDMVKIRKVALAGVSIPGVKIITKQIPTGKRI